MRFGKILTLFMLILLIFSCASTPDEEIIPPGWFLNPPSDKEDLRYYTVSVRASVLKDIEALAGEELYFEILTSLGISRTIAAMDDFSEIRSEVSGVVKDQPTEGFKLIEKQIDEYGTDRIIYILLEMQLAKQQEYESRFEEILKAGSTATIYSDEAEELVARGEIFRGTQSYIQAALESAQADNRFITEKNLDSATELLKQMSFQVIGSPATIAVGEKGIFSARLVSDTEGEDTVWSDASVLVSFRDRKKGAVLGDRFAQLRSESDGTVSFVHPSPGFTGPGKVEISLDLFRDFDSLELLKEKYEDKYDQLSEALDLISVQFDFDIISSAPSVPTGVFIVDSDFLRKPLDSSNTAQGIVSGLSGAGFIVDQVSLDSAPFFELSENELLRDLPYMVTGDIRRMIFGIAQITEFDDSAAGFTVVTEASVKVVDLDSGEILFEETLSKRVQGGESQATINTSFKELGKSFSTLLIDKLP